MSISLCISIVCHDINDYADLCSDLVPKITCQVVQPGIISRLWLRTSASTLPTRFPAVLDIGHGLPAA